MRGNLLLLGLTARHTGTYRYIQVHTGTWVQQYIVKQQQYRGTPSPPLLLDGGDGGNGDYR